MNILRILTLNKHGDFEEVLFSSLLSYFLSPQNDHGLGNIFLEKVAREAFPQLDKSLLGSAVVTSERPLGNAGKVDILTTIGDKVLAIEVKIWDRSARNVSVNDESQLYRYCRQMATEFAGKDWILIFLIPTMASRTCISEFSRICEGEFKDNVMLMTWNPGETADGFPTNRLIEKSVFELIVEVMADVKRVDLPLNTQWLLDSLYDIIPDLVEEIPEPGRFPNRDCLKNLSTWPIFEAFFTTNKRWPISLHTVVGMPYGWAGQRSGIHGNSLYRVRTVTDYYKDATDLEHYLPTDNVELELWPDVYEATRDEVNEWLVSLGLEQSALSDNRHLDANKNEMVKLISIKTGTEITTEDVERLNLILKDGFRRLMRKEKE